MALGPSFPAMPGAWTAGETLPGGDLGGATIDEYVATVAATRPGLDRAYIGRLVRRHGALTADVLGDARVAGDLGESFGGTLTAREVDHLRRHEWAREPDDVLWRRTRAGLHLTPMERQSVTERIAALL